MTPVAFTWQQAQAGARALAPRSDPAKILTGCLVLADATVILLSSAGAYVLRHGLANFPIEVASITMLAIALTLNAMQMAGAYRLDATTALVVQTWRALRGWSVVIIVLLLLAYLTKTSDDFSRAWAIGWYVLALLGFALARAGAAVQIQRWKRRGKLARTVAIVDFAGDGDALARRLQEGARGQIHLVGVFSPRCSGQIRRNGLMDLLALSRLFRIDEVILAVSGKQDGELDAVLRKLGTIPANIRLCPEMPPTTSVPRDMGLLFGQPVLTIYSQPMTGWSRIIKRAEDVVIALVTLVIVLPLLGILAALIKLESPGPVLFRQRRLGFNNNVITIFKLRTMVHRPDAETDVSQAARNDSRVTRLGRFLRRSSLDELPQLFNVLQGHMSLVGPRPHALAHNDQYAALIDDYLGRHRVQPGITGWAQVNGLRGETAQLEKMQRRVQYDLAYVEGWSLALDAKILFLTLLRGFFGHNAY